MFRGDINGETAAFGRRDSIDIRNILNMGAHSCARYIAGFDLYWIWSHIVYKDVYQG